MCIEKEKNIYKNDIKIAITILKKGGVIIYPTETVYGIGCDPLKKSAIEKIQKIKGREKDKTMLLVSCSIEQIEEMIGELDIIVKRISEKFWPGPLTLILKPKKEVPEYLYGDTGGIAFRVPSHPCPLLLTKVFGRPVISTSANISGKEPFIRYEDVNEVFGPQVDYIIENHHPMEGNPSTIIDITQGALSVVREGCIPVEKINEVI